VRKGLLIVSGCIFLALTIGSVGDLGETVFAFLFKGQYLGSYIDQTLATSIPQHAGIPSEWMQLAGNPQRTSYVDMELSDPWRVKWIWNGPGIDTQGDPEADHLRLPQGVQPVLGGGRVYVGHSDGYLRALDEATGRLVWKSDNLGGEIINAAAYDPDTDSVYVGTTNGRFWRIDAKTGKTIRSNRPGGQIFMAPLLVNHVVYIGSTNGLFYGFDKLSLQPIWEVYDAGAPLIASPAYSSAEGGMVILLAEDRTVRAIRALTGRLVWQVEINADVDPLRETVFADTFPVVSEKNQVVIVRSYLDWPKLWQPTGGAPAEVDAIREFLADNPTYQSFFVLDLKTGEQLYIAPVLIGAIGNGGDFESTPPQAVVKKLADGSEVAYVLWRNAQACANPQSCDGREDAALGEMDLKTGNIRYVQLYKNQGTIRMPTDEQGPISMAGDTILFSNWMVLGSLKIVDRSDARGNSMQNPIQTRELIPVLNTLDRNICSLQASQYCSQTMRTPCDSYNLDPGFYIYHSDTCIYDQFWTTPVRSAVISGNVFYWKSVDGAIIAIQTSQP
jgi:outer membrane protein assembly factor BamB